MAASLLRSLACLRDSSQCWGPCRCSHSRVFFGLSVQPQKRPQGERQPASWQQPSSTSGASRGRWPRPPCPGIETAALMLSCSLLVEAELAAQPAGSGLWGHVVSQAWGWEEEVWKTEESAGRPPADSCLGLKAHGLAHKSLHVVLIHNLMPKRLQAGVFVPVGVPAITPARAASSGAVTCKSISRIQFSWGREQPPALPLPVFQGVRVGIDSWGTAELDKQGTCRTSGNTAILGY